MSQAPAVLTLKLIYEKIPRLACKGLCGHSCGPVGASIEEARRMEARAGYRLHFSESTLHCGYLDAVNQRCTVYEDRPTICRLWGATPHMPCPHGCVPEPGWLPDQIARVMLKEASRIGGGAYTPESGL